MLSLDYSSSSDTSDVEEPVKKVTKFLVEEGPPKKKRKLPSLGSTFTPPDDTPNPSHYQGRTLSRPKVQGDYPTHVYLAFPIPPSLRSLVAQARSELPPLHSLIDPPPENDLAGKEEMERWKGEEQKELELHVSLSRPLYLRLGQKKELEVLLRDLGREVERFSLSLSTLTTFNNDDLTRTFLSVNVGAGYPELQTLTTSLNTLLTSLHLPPYYETPLFHTSVAWALLEPRTTVPTPTTATSSSTTAPAPIPNPTEPSPSTAAADKPKDDFPRVSKIEETLLASLEADFGALMRKESQWIVREMRMRSGGAVTKFPLGDSGGR